MTRIEIQGESLLLDYRQALVWPDQQAVLVADTHFGKSTVFRREGIALPEGSDAADLARLSALLADHQACRLYVLGDFVHGALPPGHAFYRHFNAWSAAQGVEVHVILGNHDIHLDRSALHGVQWHRHLPLGPFHLVHDPDDATTGYYFAGHIHPVARVSTRGDSLRMPVFWQRAAGMVLPSFGDLTGGYLIEAARGERLYGVGPDAVIPLSP